MLKQKYCIVYLKDILVYILQIKVCYPGNQRATVLMSCKNTEDTVLPVDPIHLNVDCIVALTE